MATTENDASLLEEPKYPSGGSVKTIQWGALTKYHQLKESPVTTSMVDAPATPPNVSTEIGAANVPRRASDAAQGPLLCLTRTF